VNENAEGWQRLPISAADPDCAGCRNPNRDPSSTDDPNRCPAHVDHAGYLAAYAITPAVAEAAGVFSVMHVDRLPDEFAWYGERAVPAIVFPWHEPNGTVRRQLKPDIKLEQAGEKPAKYVWAKDSAAQLGEFRAGDGDLVLIVEGTKQVLAAAGYAPEGVAVYGIAGCRSWQREGVPTPDLALCDGREVVIALDSDAADNREVYDAGLKLAEALKAEGARSVKFARVPGGQKSGLDDVLGKRPADRRAAYLARLVESADTKPADRAPAKRAKPTDDGPKEGPEVFFDASGLLVEKLSGAVREKFPAALTRERKVALYRDGAYRIDGTAFIGAVAELLGDKFRPTHRGAADEYTAGMLHVAGLFLPERIDVPLLNVRNGMLDLPTGTLKPHDPVYLSSRQIPVEWDADAKCPTYEAWLADQVDDQADDLEETTSTVLDPSRTPQKAEFLYGPSRSGKSTFLRLIQAMVGVENVSAVTLHMLAENRFAAANVFGKMLNCAADLSSAHVEDISIFKMMTGEDLIQADRKYGGQFAFTNGALFAFSANELPTVSESSRAYVERIKPFHFPHSFAGRENPGIEKAMLGELPGILVRWVRAWQRMNARGTYLATDAKVLHEFEVRSDRVRQWISDACRVWTETEDGLQVTEGATMPPTRATTGAELAREFNRWAEVNAGSSMGQRKILDRLRTIPGVHEVRRLPTRTRAFNVTVRKDGERPWDEPEGDPEPRAVLEASRAVSEAGRAVSSGESARANSQVSEPDEPGRAGRAVSTHPIEHGDGNAESHMTESNRGLELVGDDVSPGESAGCVETARPARAADEPEALFDAPLAPAAEYPSVDLATFRVDASVALPEGVVSFDIETPSVDHLWTSGPEFVRIAGYQEGGTIRVTADPGEMAEKLRTASTIVGHNIMSFDMLPFARDHGLDLHQLAADGRLVDTQLTEVLLNPPADDIVPAAVPKAYKLDKLGRDKFGVGKNGDLDELMKAHGGDPKRDEFHVIPVDDERYVRYCAADVDLTTRLALTQRRSTAQAAYIAREHRVAAVAAQIRMNGFRVDVPELHRRVAANKARRAELAQRLHDEYGLPLVSDKGKTFASPLASGPGKAWLFDTFGRLGIDLERTDDGSPAVGKEARSGLVARYGDNEPGMALLGMVGDLLTIRSVYDTAALYLRGDRVHPGIAMYQVSGRWSTTQPGMTVFGKRQGRHVEREIFVPEPGHVIIAADLSQVDARAIAAWCQDPAYLGLFEPDQEYDSHELVALAIWGDIGRREDAKACGHGYNYGLGFRKLAEKAGSEEVAREFMRNMEAQFPRLSAWKDEIRQDAIDNGQFLDNGWGRVLRVTPGREHTQAPALIGQSAARDIMMEGLLRMPRDLYPYLRAQVHDEIVMSVPEDRVDEIEKTVIEAMSFPWSPFWGERGHSRTVQIEAGLGKRRGRNWGAVYPKHCPACGVEDGHPYPQGCP
jgi:P4 family phage/plasmid primase-like protien